MFGEFGGGESGWWPEGHGSVDALGAAEARLLWSLRRLALMQPLGRARCHAVHIALQQEFGDAGLGIEHLLRCWLVGLSRLAVRRLAIGAPACSLLTADEAGLLRVLRDPDAGGVILVRLTGAAAAAGMVPLFVAVAGLAKIS
nr:hypothetical protein [Polymorphobacter sp.]